MKPQITFVNDNATLEKLCGLWNQVPILALDTEFIRTDTFYPIPALLQVYDGQQCYLLDLVVLNDFSTLKEVLKNPSVVKVLHSCSEDLEIFEGRLDMLPSPLFDTQIAAAFLGYGFSIGYSRLVKMILGIEASKDESRSNWLQRPLSTDQIEYAALDVIYLYQIYLHLQDQLQNSEKLAWVQESLQEMLQNYHSNQRPEHYFHRFKNAWRLSTNQQGLLFQLCLWREEEARRRNKPRNRILRDEVLFEHAQHNTFPKNYSPSSKNTLSAPEPEIPLPREVGDLVKQLKQQVEKTAEQFNIAPEVLGRKKDLTAFVSSGLDAGNFLLPKAFSGWRKKLIGDLFLKITTEWQPATNTKAKVQGA